MGRTHVLSGAVVWLAAAPALSQEQWLGSQQWLGSHTASLSAAQLAAGAVVSAGAALLPDIDHPDGRIANTFGPVTHTMCRWIGRVSGGHRHATHSILFALVMGAGMGLLAVHAVYVWWFALFVLVGFGLRGLGLDFERHGPWSSIVDCVVAGLAVFLMHGLDMSFAGYAVALGCLAHLAGDCLTPRGCPLLWPVGWRMEIPLVPRTGGKVEHRVVVPLLAVAAVVLTVRTVSSGISFSLLTG
nr:metal-dependent hydrolase [Protofrankia symbiont of Coriaria ruscifolia]